MAECMEMVSVAVDGKTIIACVGREEAEKIKSDAEYARRWFEKNMPSVQLSVLKSNTEYKRSCLESITTSPNIETVENGTTEWNRNATLLLITTRLEMEEDFQQPIQKIKLWNKISNLMKEHNYIFGPGECHNKWRNLMCTYRKNVDRSKQSGSSSIRWEYYHKFHEVYGNKSNPPSRHLRSSLHCYASTQSTPDSSPTQRENLSPHDFLKETLKCKRKRCSEDEPPSWFQRYLKKKEKDDRRKAEVEEERWHHLSEIENKKINAIKELTDILKRFLEK